MPHVKTPLGDLMGASAVLAWGRRAVLALLVIGFAGAAQAQPFGVPGDFIEFTGDVEVDFPIAGPDAFPISILGFDSLERDVDPPQGAEVLFPWLDADWRSGIDIKDVRVVVFNRPPEIPRLYVGLNMHGIAGDIDGDGDPENARDPNAIVDVPWGVDIPTALSFQIEFDLDDDGTFDLIARVPAGQPYAALQARGLVAAGEDPPGDPEIFVAPAAPPFPDAGWPDVEFVIQNFASIPFSGGRPRVPTRVGVQARFSGGDGDDLTEDRLPAFGERLAICARPEPPAQEDCNLIDDDCDGRIDEGFRTCGCETGEPGAPELCNNLDDDCDDRIDEDVADCAPCRFRGVVAMPEICNRRDDDCDGSVDEDTADCVCPGGPPVDETCDARDEDCDGQVDEHVYACVPDCDPARAVPETCNQRDDDCDGTVDEGVADCDCIEGRPPLLEVCDHRDNDCDGLVDEGLVDCSRCTEGRGLMPPGERDELCNRLDDDCDGLIDEGVEACECSCPGGDCSDLYPTAPLPELCNGVDDDCDGRIDEGTGPPTAEDCNGADDDCDGRIDENFHIGTCACEDDGPAAPETCNGADDDCDDRVDEGLDCLPCALPGGRPAAEICDLRDNDCDGEVDEELACACDPPAASEACDDEDDDCDGDVDEGLACICDVFAAERCDGLDQDCDGAVDEGLDGCDAGCDPAAGVDEVCNRLDDDCDGTVDEDLVGCGCTDDGTPGVEVCNRVDDDCDGLLDEGLRGSDGSLCDPCALGVPAAEERCNRLDDDCDGVLDEGLADCECQCDGGDCGDMYQNAPLPELCNGVDDDCDGRIDEDTRGPTAEDCNGLDDDCDGRVDENFRECGCNGGATGGEEVCNDADDDCDGFTDEGLADCLPCMFDGVRSLPEICDLRDNDCDGMVDEGLGCSQCRPYAVETCDTVDNDCDGVVDENLDGCDPAVCVRSGEPICDRADDDCDGLTDEGLNPCGCGPGGVPSTERCNDVDDDCDGLTDEGLPGCDPCALGATPRAEVCNRRDDDCNGVIDDGVEACGCNCPDGDCGDLYRIAPLSELCNQIDDDCDGRIDEDFPDGCVEPCDPAPETCNGIDDDCDGTTDEDTDPPHSEDCNGVDDDCDGRIDENFRICGCHDGGEPMPEVCNNGDDDCDDRIDEGLDCSPCTFDGVISQAEVCDLRDNDCDGNVDEGLGCVCGPADATEACDGDDDDCDGAIDENLELCAPDVCVGDGDEVCDQRDNDCDGRIDERLTGCGCIDGQPRSADVCNDIDDDCDGLIDEGLPDCDPCTLGVSPRDEQCNRRDDDCDGILDEGLVGCECTCPGGDCGDQYRTAPLPELCNGIDDDCDGTADEGACIDGCVLRVVGDAGVGGEVCNNNDDDCDGRIDEGFGADCIIPTGTDITDCSAAGRGGSSWPAALGLLLGLGVVMRRRRRARGTAGRAAQIGGSLLGLLLVIGLGPRVAQAQDVQHFQPQAGILSYFTVEGSRTPHPFQLVPSLYLSLADDPLVSRTVTDDQVIDDLDFVSLLGTLDLQLSMALLEGVEVSLDVPVHYTEGTFIEENDQDGFGLGDIRLLIRWAFWQTDEDTPISVGVSLGGTLPTGNVEGFVGEDALVLTPKLFVEFIGEKLRAAINLGLRFRPDDDVDELELRNELIYGLGVGIPITAPFELIAEAIGRIPAAEVGDRSASSPAEALLGGRYLFEQGLALTGGVGTALEADYGSPKARVFVGLAYMPDPCGDDEDGDGVGEECDTCPGQANEDQTDSDGDGIGDACDLCPEAEGGREDSDGDGIGDACDLCPESEGGAVDSDGDGIGDDCDLCPALASTEPEATTDSDGDGIGDACDLCPQKAGENTDTDGDGVGDICDLCPDVPDDQSDIDGDGEGDACDCSISVGQVNFDTARWSIKGQDSYGTLDKLAEVLEALPEIERLEIQGHTDTMDTNANNLTLSKNRAAAVRKYLVEQKKVDAGRLMACGYGEEQLAVRTGDSVAEPRNRRVNFVILVLDPERGGNRKACGSRDAAKVCPDPVAADWVPDAAPDEQPAPQSAPPPAPAE